ncbi:MAG: TRM11 family SAM-dependent methyltransferase [Fusobacteriaceae bacterium]
METILEGSTVWSFPKRGDWATHNSKFSGNFSPQVARNIILKYSNEDEIILDPMVGGGTTLIECKILNRRGIGSDINFNSLTTTKKCLENLDGKYSQTLFLSDARNLLKIPTESINLILTHPPYLDIIKYSDGNLANDLSNISDPAKFLSEINFVAQELFRVLKPNSFCAIVIGDVRRRGEYIPLASKLMEVFLQNNFHLKEDIIKVQYNCSKTRAWEKRVNNFLLIAHEHIFIFKK